VSTRAKLYLGGEGHDYPPFAELKSMDSEARLWLLQQILENKFEWGTDPNRSVIVFLSDPDTVERKMSLALCGEGRQINSTLSTPSDCLFLLYYLDTGEGLERDFFPEWCRESEDKKSLVFERKGRFAVGLDGETTDLGKFRAYTLCEENLLRNHMEGLRRLGTDSIADALLIRTGQCLTRWLAEHRADWPRLAAEELSAESPLFGINRVASELLEHGDAGLEALGRLLDFRFPYV
jgi:hypothetical protein